MHLAKCSACLQFLLIFLLLFCCISAPAAGVLSLNLEANTLSVTVENITLQALLRELAAQGVAVRIDPAINPVISANFKEKPLEQALESLLKPSSYSLLWEAQAHDAGSKAIRLAEIQVFQTGRKDLMQPLQPRKPEVITKNNGGVYYVKDEILLYIPPGTDMAALDNLLRIYNARLVANNNGLAGMVRIILPENSDIIAIAREIKSRLNLEIAQPNYAYPLQPPVYFPPGASSTGVDIPAHSPSDNSALIAILDSGLAADTALDNFVYTSLDVMSPDSPVTDTLGHGTQMAYIATGMVTPYGSAATSETFVPIIPIRTFDDNGFTTDQKIWDAINFALAKNARVLSLSWGSETRSGFMEKAFAYAADKGLIMVASAGNDPTGRPVYPAAYASVIGVGALEPHGKAWENSNYGNFVALYAPGFANLPVGHKGDPGLYAGTSIAAAFVANAIAGYLSANPAATPQEIRVYLNSKF